MTKAFSALAGACFIAFAISEGPVHAGPLCPPIGDDTGCGTVVTVTDTGTSVVQTGQGPYDGGDDTLVGVVNNSSRPVSALELASLQQIFGFDGDGISSSFFGAPGNVLDNSGYGGPNAYYSNLNAGLTSGTVNFIAPIAPGGTGYFSLENTFSAAVSIPTALVNGNLPTAAPVGIAVSNLPSSDHLLTKIPGFLTNYGLDLPLSTQAYFSTAVSETTPLTNGSFDLHQAAGIAAPALQLFGDGLDVASALDIASGPIGIEKDLVPLFLSGVGSATGLGLNIPDAITCGNFSLSCLSGYSLFVSAAALTAIACTVACIPAIASFAISDLIVPELKQFAADPFDPNYTSVFVLPSSIQTAGFQTGDAAVDAAATQAISQFESAAAYLLAANVSINRYSSALSQGDASSAVLQLQAILHYLALYNSAIKDARAALAHLKSLPEFDAVLSVNYDTAAFLDLQKALTVDGFSASDLAYFGSLGLDSSQISAMLNATLDFQPPSFVGTVGSIYDGLDSELQSVSFDVVATNVPEPSTSSLFFVVVPAALYLVRRRRRPNLIS